jgi:rod shape-determining protein MreC
MNLKRYRDFVIVLLALAVPFWFLRASMRDPKQNTGADRVIVRLAAPVQYAAATLARGLSNIWGNYVYLLDVKEDNARQAALIARLRERTGCWQKYQ